MDLELAVDAMELAEHIDQMVLCSGEGDFRSLIEAVQRRGRAGDCRVHDREPDANDGRRTSRQADEFIDLAQLKLKLGRNPSDRLDPRQDERRGSKIGVPESL
ncbi:NYN domain-containing protein [Bradyrhizobium sp. LMG 9283]|uniref:NYN domain-containing protein n=1 Tax=Bradyrhizobium sp. LMG 9283 TaxID=592064 RepID=UPI0038910ED3